MLIKKPVIGIFFLCTAVLFMSCHKSNSAAAPVTKPIADFAVDTLSEYAPAKLKLSSTSLNATSSSWDFGNGKTSSNAADSVVFSSPGTYTITLTARDATGATNSKTFTFVAAADPALIAWYPLAADALDASGSGNNAAPSNGMSYSATDRFGNASKAALFNGSSYIGLPSNLLNHSNMSISIWFHVPFPLPAATLPLLGMQNAAITGNPTAYSPVMYIGMDGNIRSHVYSCSMSQPSVSPAINSLSSMNGWVHAALVVSGGQQKFYLNGTPVFTYGGTCLQTASYAFIGAAYGDPTSWPGWSAPTGYHQFTGAISDVRFYSRGLNDQEVLALFEEQ